MSGVRLILALHDHQPVGNFDGVFGAAYRDSYLPFLEVLEGYPEIPFVLHTSGPLLEWLVECRPEYISRVRALVEAGRVEILGGSGTTVRIRLRAADLLAGSYSTGQRRIVSAQPGTLDLGRAQGATSATGAAGAAAVRVPRPLRMVPLLRRRGARLYVITPTLDASGRLMVSVVPFTSKRVGAQVRRLLRRRR